MLITPKCLSKRSSNKKDRKMPIPIKVFDRKSLPLLFFIHVYKYMDFCDCSSQDSSNDPSNDSSCELSDTSHTSRTSHTPTTHEYTESDTCLIEEEFNNYSNNNILMILLHRVSESIFSAGALNLTTHIIGLLQSALYLLVAKIWFVICAIGLSGYVDKRNVKRARDDRRNKRESARKRKRPTRSVFDTLLNNFVTRTILQWTPLTFEIYSLAYHENAIYKTWMLLNAILSLLALGATIWRPKKIVRVLCFIAPFQIDDFDLHSFIKLCGTGSILVGKLFVLYSIYTLGLIDIVTGAYVINRTHKNIMRLLHEY